MVAMRFGRRQMRGTLRDRHKATEQHKSTQGTPNRGLLGPLRTLSINKQALCGDRLDDVV
jgi:hypothetical protein